MTSADRPVAEGKLFTLSNGEVRAWTDGGVHLKAVTDFGDPVELSETEVRALIACLAELLLELEQV
jgi:hypothetical protein